MMAAQMFEFADEGFCQAQVPLQRRFLCGIIAMCVTNATAQSRDAALPGFAEYRLHLGNFRIMRSCICRT